MFVILAAKYKCKSCITPWSLDIMLLLAPEIMFCLNRSGQNAELTIELTFASGKIIFFRVANIIDT